MEFQRIWQKQDISKAKGATVIFIIFPFNTRKLLAITIKKRASISARPLRIKHLNFKMIAFSSKISYTPYSKDRNILILILDYYKTLFARAHRNTWFIFWAETSLIPQKICIRSINKLEFKLIDATHLIIISQKVRVKIQSTRTLPLIVPFINIFLLINFL